MLPLPSPSAHIGIAQKIWQRTVEIVSANKFSWIPAPQIRQVKHHRKQLRLTSAHRRWLEQHAWTSGYHIKILLEATRYVDFRDKIILEIGGSNLPRELVFDILGVKKWVCVNLTQDTGTPEKTYPLNHPDTKSIIHENDFILFQGSATEIGKGCMMSATSAYLFVRSSTFLSCPRRSVAFTIR